MASKKEPKSASPPSDEKLQKPARPKSTKDGSKAGTNKSGTKHAKNAKKQPINRQNRYDGMDEQGNAEKDNGGRPLREFDQTTFEGLCRIMCTQREIAGIFKCDMRTLEGWAIRTYADQYDEEKRKTLRFSDIYDDLSAYGKASLRRAQFKLAEKNASMGVWLGKQYLGQKEPDSDNRMADEGTQVQIYLPDNNRPDKA